MKNLIVAGLLICLTGIGQMGQSSRAGYITEGVGVESIVVGKSTKEDILKKYGSDFKIVKHNEYSLEIVYEKIGLSFYYCQQDPNAEIFVIEVEPPYRGRTSKGIVMGKSTREDVVKAYLGRRVAVDETLKEMSEMEFEGIQFYFGKKSERDNKEVVIGIDVIERTGLRQCDDLYEKVMTKINQ